MKKPQSRDAVSAAVIVKIQKLRAEELNYANIANRNRVEERCRAFRLGALIAKECADAKYGDNRMQQIADQCGLSKQAVYNYLYLYRGATVEDAIRDHPKLSREYWQALGSSIDPCDLMGTMVWASLIRNPVIIVGRDPDDWKPDPSKVTEIGTLVRECRKEIEQLKVGYAFAKFRTLGADDPPPDLEQGWSDTRIHGGTHDFLLPCKTEDQGRVDKAMLEVQKLMDGVSQVTGLQGRISLIFGKRPEGAEAGSVAGKPIRSAPAKSVLYERRRDQVIASAEAESTPTAAATVDQKVFFGRCESVLRDKTKFPPRSVDVVITDPPYSQEFYDPWRPEGRIEHDAEKTVDDQVKLVGEVFSIMVNKEIIKERFIAFIFFPMDYVHLLVPCVLKAFHGLPDLSHQVLVWDKGLCPNIGGHRSFGHQAEAILYVNVGDKHLSEIQVGNETRQLHPSVFNVHAVHRTPETQWKPAPLLEQLIQLSTSKKDRERQVVLDMFSGTGATGLAAMKCGADFRLIECHKGQYDLARARVMKALTHGPEGEEADPQPDEQEPQ